MNAALKTLLNKFIRYSFFLRIKQLLIKFRLFDYYYQINFLGMVSILLARENLSTIIDFIFNMVVHGLDYIKSQHLNIRYYQKWIKNNERYDLGYINKAIDNLKLKPVYSLMMSSPNGNALWLDQAIDSVRRQCYPYWELYLPANESAPPDIQACLAKWRATGDPRINILASREELSAAQTYNRALAEARGDFVAFLGAGDTLAPDALYVAAELLNAHPDAEFIYSDEDKIQEDCIRFDPFFKPDWSPDLCRSMAYTGNLALYRRRTVARLGGLREAAGASFAYDLVLRLTEAIDPAPILHLPRILYHARSTPAALNQLPGVSAVGERGQAVLEDYWRRHDIGGEVVPGRWPGTYRLKRSGLEPPRVVIIIPFRDKADLLETCVASILARTDYPNYEILLVNNRSTEPATAAFLEKTADNPAIRCLSYDQVFNFAAINNFAVSHSGADHILFLNSDTEVISPEWLTAMMEHMTRKEVGAVGAKLIYYDGTVQHAGVVMGITQICGHAFRGFPADHPGYFGQLQIVRNCSAVTGACMLVKKAVFQAVGGFDHQNLPVGYNDVDLCLKMLAAGYLIVWTPYALLYHREYASRGDDRDLQDRSRQEYQRVIGELEFFEKKWRRYIDHDPYYNPNLTRLFENYGF